jgi:predicted 3-demethylubiquinone-9 3-methyltransferase (glyoxalase superfamily)
MAHNKIIPALWYHSKDGKMKQVKNYYSKIFKTNLKAGKVIPLGDTPSGYAEMCHVKFFGSEYLFMTTATQHHKFNDAIAIMVNCKDQKEIDKYWNYFTKEGEESMCGWCMDKFGLRWQIIPKNMGELMSKPNAWQVMSKQKKIVIKEYLR